MHQWEESICLYSYSNQKENKKSNQSMIALFRETKFHHVDICERVKSIMLLKGRKQVFTW